MLTIGKLGTEAGVKIPTIRFEGRSVRVVPDQGGEPPVRDVSEQGGELPMESFGFVGPVVDKDTVARIDAMLAAAQQAGALGGKVCGAGGGGCLFCFAEPGDVPAVRDALVSSGAELLAFALEEHGLRITTS